MEKVYQLNINHHLMTLDQVKVMTILNVSPDSFYENCASSLGDMLAAAARAKEEGADMFDLGACSTRPSSSPATEEQELSRLLPALKLLREAWPDMPISVDTFRVSVAEQALRLGADVINDVSGGSDEMYELIAHARVPYILTYARENTDADLHGVDLMADALDFLERRMDKLYRMGATDVILDPGFGFAKTLEQNYDLLANMEGLKVLNAPILAGVSRKSMLYRLLDITPSEALNATTAVHMLAMERGADILRVHDTRAAREAVRIHSMVSKL